MLISGSRLTGAVVLAAVLARASSAGAVPYDKQPALARALYTGGAMVVNVMPIVSAFFAPRCLPGYVVCKITFAGVSLVAAADQFLFSMGSDTAQTRAILYRGFSGDWFLTGRHIAGEAEPRPLPDPPPPSNVGGSLEPPPQ